MQAAPTLAPMGFRFGTRVGPFSFSMGPAGCLAILAVIAVGSGMGAFMMMMFNPLIAIEFGAGVLVMGAVVLGAIASDRRQKRKAAEAAAQYRPPHWR